MLRLIYINFGLYFNYVSLENFVLFLILICRKYYVQWNFENCDNLPSNNKILPDYTKFPQYFHAFIIPQLITKPVNKKAPTFGTSMKWNSLNEAEIMNLIKYLVDHQIITVF